MAAHPLSYNWEVKNSVSTWLMLSELTVSLEVARQATWEIPVVKWAKFEWSPARKETGVVGDVL